MNGWGNNRYFKRDGDGVNARVTDALVSDDEITGLERILRLWFPHPAFAAAARIGDYTILAQEQALVANAVVHRRQEFATGRWLSRQGLQQFGCDDAAILIGRLRNPLWPASVIGTISHDGMLCAAVLLQSEGPAPAQQGTDIGIDLVYLPQRSGRLNDLAPMFMAHEKELDVMAAFQLAVDPAVLLFSVKESIVKAMSRRLNDFIDMRAIAIHRTDTLGFGFSLGNDCPDVDILAAVCGNYLITAVKAPL
ncbi:4'-phosphopantetheinyl transferase family protein [Glaciimonas sp. GNP009]